MSAGHFIAFIDDDAIPEPEWLSDLSAAFEGGAAGAGGFTYDHTGYAFQSRHIVCDRLGNADLSVNAEDIDQYNFPFSNKYPSLLGTNSAFVRDEVCQIGGFDEEFEYYLDETDLCLRLIDGGGRINEVSSARVHHKFLASHLRNELRALSNPYPVLKNKIYFSLVNNKGHHTLTEVQEDAVRFFNKQRSDTKWCVENGRLPEAALDEFDEAANRAWVVGLKRGLSGQRRLRRAEFFRAPAEFRRFEVNSIESPRTFVFISQNFPPRMDGVGRYTADISRAIAAKGHTVHVLTRGEDQNRVDLEEGVWIHRLLDKDHAPKVLQGGGRVPPNVWSHSRSLLDEIERISTFRKIDVIEASSWDCEGLATLLDGQIPVATNVVTTLSHWLDTHEELRADAKWMNEFGEPVQAAERLMFERSDMILAASKAIVESIEERYRIPLKSDTRLRTCIHGMEDMRPLPRRAPAALADADLSDGHVRILFLGRLELRKGIDHLLTAVPRVLRANPRAEFWIAGDDTLMLDGGLTARQRFMRDHGENEEIAGRVHFLGKVSHEELRWLYANCDIYTSPSRFESFGLIFVEAMMFSKPSVGTRTSGIAEIVEHNVTGLLARVDDAASLEKEITGLAADGALRRRLGERARLEFERIYDVSAVADLRIALLSEIMRVEPPIDAIRVPEVARQTDRGHLLMQGHPLEIAVSTVREVHLTFYAHPWSGVAQILLDGRVVQDIDLYDATGRFLTVRVPTEAATHLAVVRAGHKAALAHDTEVIFHKAVVCLQS